MAAVLHRNRGRSHVAALGTASLSSDGSCFHPSEGCNWWLASSQSSRRRPLSSLHPQFPLTIPHSPSPAMTHTGTQGQMTGVGDVGEGSESVGILPEVWLNTRPSRQPLPGSWARALIAEGSALRPPAAARVAPSSGWGRQPPRIFIYLLFAVSADSGLSSPLREPGFHFES